MYASSLVSTALVAAFLLQESFKAAESNYWHTDAVSSLGIVKHRCAWLMLGWLTTLVFQFNQPTVFSDLILRYFDSILDQTLNRGIWCCSCGNSKKFPCDKFSVTFIFSFSYKKMLINLYIPEYLLKIVVGITELIEVLQTMKTVKISFFKFSWMLS